jgi:hypothetical protein
MTRTVPQTAPIPVLTRRTISGLLNLPQIRLKITSATEDAVLHASNGPNRRDSFSTERQCARSPRPSVSLSVTADSAGTRRAVAPYCAPPAHTAPADPVATFRRPVARRRQGRWLIPGTDTILVSLKTGQCNRY